MAVQILGIEYHLPDRVLTNEDLKRENPDWLMNKVYTKLGIAERRIAAPDETASDLAFAACKKLLARNIVPGDRIDYLIFCTQSPDHFLPSAACVLQDRLGLRQEIGAFDFNLGCSGYVYGLSLARSLVQSGQAKYVLLATGDTYTKFLHRRDRSVRSIFGDGAAATLIGPGDGPGELGPFVLRTNGAGAKDLIVPAGGCRLPHSAATATERPDLIGCTRSQDNLWMDGGAIFEFAVNCVPPLIADTLAAASLSPGQIDWYVYHQANKYILGELAKLSDVPPEKMPVNYEKIGNTVSSSIPMVIRDYVAAGKIRAGQRLLLIGFGVGYSWAGCTLTWGKTD
ncbi:MAG: ketoacyl-ACP synthase III [Phycisphaerae bacterium]|nr:ketoacyl-ACP synthase III [Phycisphaerae bacterium]